MGIDKTFNFLSNSYLYISLLLLVLGFVFVKQKKINEKNILILLLWLSLQPNPHFPRRLGQPQRDVRGRASAFRRGQFGRQGSLFGRQQHRDLSHCPQGRQAFCQQQNVDPDNTNNSSGNNSLSLAHSNDQ